MTTLTVNTYSGTVEVAGRRITRQQVSNKVVVASNSCEVPVLADGLLFMVATLISRLFTRVFGTTDYSADPVELRDYNYPPSCCCV